MKEQDGKSFATSGSMLELDSEIDDRQSQAGPEERPVELDRKFSRQNTFDEPLAFNPDVQIDKEAEERLHSFLASISALGSKSHMKTTDSTDITTKTKDPSENGEGAKTTLFNKLVARQAVQVYLETTPHVIMPTIDFAHCLIRLAK